MQDKDTYAMFKHQKAQSLIQICAVWSEPYKEFLKGDLFIIFSFVHSERKNC